MSVSLLAPAAGWPAGQGSLQGALAIENGTYLSSCVSEPVPYQTHNKTGFHELLYLLMTTEPCARLYGLLVSLPHQEVNLTADELHCQRFRRATAVLKQSVLQPRSKAHLLGSVQGRWHSGMLLVGFAACCKSAGSTDADS